MAKKTKPVSVEVRVMKNSRKTKSKFLNKYLQPAVSISAALVLVLQLIAPAMATQPQDPPPLPPTISIDSINGDSPPFNFVCPTNPLFSPVIIIGHGTGHAPPGQVQQYGVEVDWGDGVVENSQDNPSSVSAIFSPPSGNHVDFTYTFSTNSGHVYSSPGSYTITLLLYHSQAPGQDNQIEAIYSITVCVITQPAHLTVIKQVDGGSASASDFNIHIKNQGQDVNGSPYPGSEQGITTTLAPGTYEVSEDTPPQDYTQTSIVCDQQQTATVVLNENDNKTCTITNTYNFQPPTEGTLTVIKEVINNNGGTKTASDFSFSVDGGIAIPFESDSQNDLIVAAGLHNVTEPAVTGYSTTYDNCSEVNVPAGGFAICTITNHALPAEIQGTKFEDMNGNGIKDQDELGLEDWTIHITDGGQFSDSAVTGSDGSYSFTDLAAGMYSLFEDLIPGWAQTTPDPAPIVLGNGQTITDVDFGNFKLGKISGYKFDDENNNGVWDWNDLNQNGIWDLGEGEPPMNKWTINLNGPINNSAVTDDTGYYTFEDLTAGTYSVSEEPQAGWAQTLPQGAYSIDAISGTDSRDNNFGNYQAPTTGTIIIQKQTVPSGGQATFDFTGDITGSITDGQTIPVEKEAGPYTVTETGKAGWALTDITCIEDVNSNSTGDIPTRTANINLEAGETVTCTFTNTGITPTLKITKNISPHDSSTFNVFVSGENWNTKWSNAPLGDGGVLGPKPIGVGTYTITEEAVSPAELSDYVLTFGRDCPGGVVTLNYGDAKTCALYNTLYVPPPPTSTYDLAVVKSVDNPAPAEGDTLTYTIIATNNSSVAVSGIFVTDILPSFLTFVSATPSVGTYDATTSTWTIGNLDAGASATLTITATVNSGAAEQQIVNTSTIGSDPGVNDSNLDNNTSTATSTVAAIVPPPPPPPPPGGGGGGGVYIPPSAPPIVQGTTTPEIATTTSPGEVLGETIVIEEPKGEVLAETGFSLKEFMLLVLVLSGLLLIRSGARKYSL